MLQEEEGREQLNENKKIDFEVYLRRSIVFFEYFKYTKEKNREILQNAW